MAKPSSIAFPPSEELDLSENHKTPEPVVELTATDKILRRLQEPLNPSAIQTRLKNPNLPESKNNPKLSYVSKPYVIKTLNSIFGYAGWSTETIRETYHKDENGQPVAVSITVRLIVQLPNGRRAHHDGEGVGNSRAKTPNWGNMDMVLGDAWAMAVKRAATNFGDPFGLSLYPDEAPEEETPQATEGEEKTPTPIRPKTTSYGSRIQCVNYAECGNTISDYDRKDGKHITIADQVKMRGGEYCYDCYQAKRG